MPVISPKSATSFFIHVSGKDSGGVSIPEVSANGLDRFVVLVKPIKWDGSIYSESFNFQVTFSDGRDMLELCSIGVMGVTFEVMSQVSQTLVLTFTSLNSERSFSKDLSLLFV